MDSQLWASGDLTSAVWSKESWQLGRLLKGRSQDRSSFLSERVEDLHGSTPAFEDLQALAGTSHKEASETEDNRCILRCITTLMARNLRTLLQRHQTVTNQPHTKNMFCSKHLYLKNHSTKTAWNNHSISNHLVKRNLNETTVAFWRETELAELAACRSKKKTHGSDSLTHGEADLSTWRLLRACG